MRCPIHKTPMSTLQRQLDALLAIPISDRTVNDARRIVELERAIDEIHSPTRFHW